MLLLGDSDVARGRGEGDGCRHVAVMVTAYRNSQVLSIVKARERGQLSEG